MDLAKYKKTWKKQPEVHHKISISEIYKMTQAKSTSIVKWIFIIGAIEFIFMNSLTLISDYSAEKETIEKFGLTTIIYITQIIAFVITLYFLFMFYKNYREISVIDTTKNLMTKIIQTRKTVRNYVIYNLALVVFISVIMAIGALKTEYSHFSMKKSTLFLITMLVITIFIVFVFWLFYQLLYGILLKKLKKNYRSLVDLELK